MFTNLYSTEQPTKSYLEIDRNVRERERQQRIQVAEQSVNLKRRANRRGSFISALIASLGA